jgi:cytochrome c biogenesis protein CcmG/thiol:disulfide interchange protein DsbE
MTVRQQWAIVGIVFVLLGSGLFAGVKLFADDLFPVGYGSPAPNFAAKDLRTGTVRTLADYRGKVILLNVWATWCEPCKVEMPSMEELYRAYGPRGVHVVAVSIDNTASEDSIRAFAKGLGLTFEILHDPTQEIERAYQTTGYPESFVIDSRGTIRKKWISATDWNSPANRALFDELLGASSGAPVTAKASE